MKKIYFALIVISALSLSGCVMVKNEEWAKLQQDIADIKRDSEDVKKEKDALGLQLDSLKSKIQEIEKSTGAQFSTRVVALEKTISDAEKDIRKKQADIGGIIMVYILHGFHYSQSQYRMLYGVYTRKTEGKFGKFSFLRLNRNITAETAHHRLTKR